MRVSERLLILQGQVAPQELRRRLLELLDAEDEARVTPPPVWPFVWGTLATAATAVIIMVTVPQDHPEMARSLVQQAIIGLAAEQSVETGDPFLLSSWLRSRLGYAVEIPAITNAVLLGGSIAHVEGISAPAVAYKLNGAQLTYFALPTVQPFRGKAVNQGVNTLEANGYHIATWTERGSLRALVGTAATEDLVAVAEECKKKAATSSP